MRRDAATPGGGVQDPAAGPLATFGVILVCLAIDVAIVGPHRLTHAVALDQDITITPVLLSLSWLLPMNVLLLVFNLMPAFPLDGGRIARRSSGASQARRPAARSSRRGTDRAVAAAGRHSASGCCWPTALRRAVADGDGIHDLPGGALRGGAVGRDERIEGVRVADIMDPQPVAIPIDSRATRHSTSTSLATAGHGFRSSTARATWRASPAGRGRRPRRRRRGMVDDRVGLDTELAGGWQVRPGPPDDGSDRVESLGVLGAVMAVDDDGVL